MKTKYFLKTLLIIGICFICLRLMVDNAKASDTLYEYYSGSNDGYTIIDVLNIREGQLFKIGGISTNKPYNITSVKLMLSRVGTYAGIIYVDIYPFNAITGHVMLGMGSKSGSMSGSSLTTTGAYYEIPLNGWFIVNPSLLYVISVYASPSPFADCHLHYDSTSPGYTDGYRLYSNDAWVSTTTDGNKDYNFYVYAKDCQSSAVTVTEDLTHCSGSYDYIYDEDTGFSITNIYNGDTPNFFKYENDLNVTGTHENVWDSNLWNYYIWANYSSFLNIYENPIHATGQQEITINNGQYNVYANYTAINPTFNKYENIIDATGTHESIFTNWIYNVWANYTGTGGGGCSFPFFFNYSDSNITINVTVDGCGYVNLTNGSVNESNWFDLNFGSILFDSDQFSIFLALTLFMFFFYTGYKEKKRSGGALMLLSGFILLSFEVLAVLYLSSFYVIPLLTPVGIFIILLGIRKFLYPVEGEKVNSEGQ